MLRHRYYRHEYPDNNNNNMVSEQGIASVRVMAMVLMTDGKKRKRRKRNSNFCFPVNKSEMTLRIYTTLNLRYAKKSCPKANATYEFCFDTLPFSVEHVR